MTLITTREAAAIVGVTPDGIRSAARDGRLPIALTLGTGQRLFDRAVAEAFKEKRNQKQ